MSIKHDIVFAGKGKISPVIIIAIVVTIAASVVLVILAYCFLRRRARKKSDAINEESPKQSDGLLNYHGMLMQVLLCSYDHNTISSFSILYVKESFHYGCVKRHLKNYYKLEIVKSSLFVG